MHSAKVHSLLAARRVRLAVSTFVMVVAAAAIMAGPLTTQASAAVSDCWSGRFCVWMDPNYVNVRATWTDNNINYCYTLAAAYNNNISSAHNLTGHDVLLYDGANCTGDAALLGHNMLTQTFCPDFNDTTLMACGLAPLQRNEISSLKFL